MEIKEQYEAAVLRYIKAFEEKQGYGFEQEIRHGWLFGDYYCFSLDDIRHDIDTNQPKGLIFEWFENAIKFPTQINYQSYCMGLRFDMDGLC